MGVSKTVRPHPMIAEYQVIEKRTGKFVKFPFAHGLETNRLTLPT